MAVWECLLFDEEEGVIEGDHHLVKRGEDIEWPLEPLSL